jgi:hypothetical protein
MATSKTISEQQMRFTSPPPQEASEESAIESRRLRIERLAYQRSEQRGFAPGHEMEDWLEAEREVDGSLPEESKH